MKLTKKVSVTVFILLGFIAVSYILYLFFNTDEVVDMRMAEASEFVNIQDFTDEEMYTYIEEVKSLNQDNKENVIIVTTKEEITDDFGAVNIVSGPNNQYFIEYANSNDRKNALEKFNEDKSIYAATENTVYEFQEDVVTSSAYNSWGIEATGLDTAISIANGKNLPEVVVGIIDTGLDIELFNTNYSNKLKGIYNVFDFFDMYDNVGHGTHIAGTIAEGTPDNVKLLPIKVTDSRDVYTVDLISALNYIISDKKVDVLNLSYGSSTYDPNMNLLYFAAYDMGIILVGAAGNEGKDEAQYPASYDYALSVSSVDSSFNLSDFSNYHEKVTLSAPGTDINSINGLNSGTSMAAPHVASAAALIKSYNLNYSPEDIKEFLIHHATDLGDVGKDDKFGYGFLSMDNIEYCEDSGCIDKLTYFNDNPIDNYDRENIVKLEIIPESIVVPENRFYSVTDLYQVEVKAYIDDTNYNIEKLVNLPDIEITGYDPYETGLQSVTAVYNEVSVSFDVNWDLSRVRSGLITIEAISSPLNYIVFEGLSNIDSSIETVVVPSEINGVIVKEVGLFLEKGTIPTNNVKNIVLSDGVSLIHEKAFENNQKIETIKSLAPSIAVGDNSFKNAINLKNFEGNLSSVGISAFENNIALKNISFSKELSKISDFAFLGTQSLTSINLPDSVISIGDEAFSYSGLKSIVVGSGLSSIGTDAFVNAKFIESISISTSNITYDSRNNSNAIIEKATNKLVLGSYNTVIPTSVKTIGNHAFYNYDMYGIFVVPEGVEVIEENAIVGIDTVSQIVFPRTLSDMHYTNVYDYELSDLIFRVYIGSYALDRIKDVSHFNANYISIDPINVDVIKNVNEYKSFDKVKETDYNITLNYDYQGILPAGYIDEIISSYSVDVKYSGNNDSFRFGDSKYTLGITNDIGYYFEEDVDILVNKSVPQYTLPANITGNLNEKLSDVVLPSNFYWENPNEMMSTPGNNTFKVKYIPDDSINYSVVNDIDLNVYVVDPTSVVSSSSDYMGFYDGNSHCIGLNLKPGNHVVKYSINNLEYNLSDNPCINEVGEYTINYTIDSDGYADYTGSNKITIYGIKSFDAGLTSNGSSLLIGNFDNSFNSIKNKINVFSLTSSYQHLNIDDSSGDGLETKTGDKILINVNGEKDIVYDLIVLGDVYPDGKISALDYVRIKNHIMSTTVIVDPIILSSADANNDSKVSALDYVRIKNHIMDGGN